MLVVDLSGLLIWLYVITTKLFMYLFSLHYALECSVANGGAQTPQLSFVLDSKYRVDEEHHVLCNDRGYVVGFDEFKNTYHSWLS